MDEEHLIWLSAIIVMILAIAMFITMGLAGGKSSKQFIDADAPRIATTLMEAKDGN